MRVRERKVSVENKEEIGFRLSGICQIILNKDQKSYGKLLKDFKFESERKGLIFFTVIFGYRLKKN